MNVVFEITAVVVSFMTSEISILDINFANISIGNDKK